MAIVFIVILLVVCVGMPLAYSWRVGKSEEPTRAAWLMKTGEAAVIISLIVLVGRWDIAGYYTRFVLLPLFLLAVFLSWRRHLARPWRSPDGKPVWRTYWSTALSLVLLGAALAYILIGLAPRPGPTSLAFPLKDGRFMVGQGGNVRLLNHHATHPEQRYAADVTAINGAGFRATGILPKQLDRYTIFGAPVVSPCAGEVKLAQDGLPDLVPPQADRDNPAGNHVILSCGGIEVTLAHLREGSIVVESGETVAVGDAIGRVGNSGNTTEPHLHIHAVDAGSGEGVAMSFGGRIPVRNSVFRR